MTIARTLFGAAALAMLAVLAGPAMGADSPDGKPVRIIVPTGVGSGTDLTARQIAASMGKAWSVPVVVENKAGASGMIGTEFVAKATPDGYTLLATYAQHYTNQLVMKTPYDAVKDFEPVARVANSALVISVSTNSPYKTLGDVIEAARKKPGVITYGSSGNGTTSHLAATLFEDMTKVKLNHIPYKAPGQVALDAASGQIDLSFNGMSSVLPLIKGGRLRALAVTTLQRSQSLPDVPTVAESGYPGYETASPIWLFVPRGTPQAVVDRLSAGVTAAAGTTEFQDLCRQQGLEVDIQDAATAKAAGPGELEKWRKLMSTAGAPKD
ncbi:Bug family tripartite tricarboxylate transporter substrate binding protein [Bordetella bronchiseptica]|uniref:Bug family tripartite tricarboxylate transporter substrate binding protein n=1 Tax=Bordetella bronchiseptica TaxID=518 RepID=UPI000459985B|nr:tripartite tricarboxylate transporter substrate binding protein [Bordetella bronchiseptica]KCV55635.1 tripartite tricarboxylate transporter family receptor [Bordetella bronchiseptica 7E71]